MSNPTGKIIEIITNLNDVIADIARNDGLEFDVDEILDAIDTHVEELSEAVAEAIELARS